MLLPFHPPNRNYPISITVLVIVPPSRGLPTLAAQLVGAHRSALVRRKSHLLTPVLTPENLLATFARRVSHTTASTQTRQPGLPT